MVQLYINAVILCAKDGQVIEGVMVTKNTELKSQRFKVMG